MNKILVLHMFRELELGGIQTFLKNIYDNIDRKQIEFDFLVNSRGVLDDYFNELGSKIYYIPNIKECGPLRYKKNLDAFFKLHKEYKIIHIHFDQLSGLIAEVAKKNGIKVRISHAHIVGNNTGLIGKIYKMSLQNKIYNNITDYLACSKNAAEWLFRKNANKANIVYNGIEIDKFQFDNNIRKKVRKKLNINQNTFVIGHVGRMSPEKNQIFAVDIFEKYIKYNSDCLLVFVGDGSYLQTVKKYVRKKKLNDKVLFLGNRSDVNELYNSFDIFLFPSQFEGLGIALIEAQINGLICFTSTNVPIETKISDNIHYIELNEKSLEWAKIIINEYKNINRKEELCKIQKEKYDIKIVSNEMLEFYKKSLN